jgi:zinc transport system ATP-binding protein
VQIVRISDMSYSINGEDILQNINLSLNEGEILAFLGPNGGGKTTLSKLILGLLKPNSGSIELFDGKKEPIGYVPQKLDGDNIFLPFDVWQIVDFGAKGDKLAIKEAIEIVGLEGLEHRFWQELSGGQRQRALIARAIASKSRLLIMDEPTVGLDSKSQVKFYDWLGLQSTINRKSIILITHDCGVLCRFNHRVVTVDRSVVESPHIHHAHG